MGYLTQVIAVNHRLTFAGNRWRQQLCVGSLIKDVTFAEDVINESKIRARSVVLRLLRASGSSRYLPSEMFILNVARFTFLSNVNRRSHY